MASFKVAEDPLESMLSPGRSPARNRRRLSKSGTEKENADPKSPLSVSGQGSASAVGSVSIFSCLLKDQLSLLQRRI
jgi:hypothetical protein